MKKVIDKVQKYVAKGADNAVKYVKGLKKKENRIQAAKDAGYFVTQAIPGVPVVCLGTNWAYKKLTGKKLMNNFQKKSSGAWLAYGILSKAVVIGSMVYPMVFPSEEPLEPKKIAQEKAIQIKDNSQKDLECILFNESRKINN